MDPVTTKTLQDIGFSKGEIKVYFALLELGNSTSGPVIIKSGTARSKVYDILEKLKLKGLVSEMIKADTRYFQAASPDRIIDIIKQKELNLAKEEEAFKKILPELKLKEKMVQEKQEVKAYIGLEGVKSFFNEVLNQLNKGDDYLAMTLGPEDWKSEYVVNFGHDFHIKRAEKGANAKILYNIKSQSYKEKMDFTRTGLYEIRSTDVSLPTGIEIVKDTVGTLIWGKKPKVFAVINKENADHYRKFFYYIWEKSAQEQPTSK